MTEIDLAVVDVVEYLASKGVQVHKAAGDEVTARCVFCPNPSTRNRGKLYVNTVEGVFQCHVCGERGNIRTLIKHFGDTVKPGHDTPRANRRALLEMATTIGEQMLVNNDEQISYLLGPERGLTAETIMAARLGFVPPRWSLAGSMPGTNRTELAEVGILNKGGHDFYENRILIPYLSRGSVVQLRAKQPGAKYFTAAGDAVRLYNTDDLDGASEVIITEGEFDCLRLRQTLRASQDARLRKVGVVGLPGTTALPHEFESYFANARRVFVGFDGDIPGKVGAERVAQKIGTKARVLDLPDGLDWTDWLQRGGTDADVAAMLDRHRGGRLVKMAGAGQRWREQRATQTGLKLGYASLDAVIKPGLLPGQLVVWLANTGVGKTIFALNVAYNNLGRRHLLVSLEMTVEECYERLYRIYLFHHPKSTASQVEQAFSNLLICDENRMSAGDLEGLIEEYEDEIGLPPQLCTVDYLGYFARGAEGNGHYEKTSEAAMSLKAIAKMHKLVMIAPHQVSRSGVDGRPLKASDARDSGVVEETADFLFTLWRPDDANLAVAQTVKNGTVVDPNNRICLGIEKSRHGGKGKTFNLIFGELSLVIVDSLDAKAAKSAGDENYLAKRGYDWDQLRKQAAAPQQPALPGTAVPQVRKAVQRVH